MGLMTNHTMYLHRQCSPWYGAVAIPLGVVAIMWILSRLLLQRRLKVWIKPSTNQRETKTKLPCFIIYLLVLYVERHIKNRRNSIGRLRMSCFILTCYYLQIIMVLFLSPLYQQLVTKMHEIDGVWRGCLETGTLVLSVDTLMPRYTTRIFPRNVCRAISTTIQSLVPATNIRLQ